MRTQAPRRPGVVGAVALALFVHAGSIKSHPLLAWLGIDLTVLLGLMLVAAAAADLIRARTFPNAVWMPFAVAVVMSPGLVGATTAYGIDKSVSFFSITLLAMVAGTIVLREERQRAAFLRTLAVLGLVVTILVTVAPGRTSDWSTVVTLPGTNTISTSQMILAGAIALVMDAILHKRRVFSRVLLGVVGAAMVFTALNTGSRGPVVSVAISIVVALLLAPAFKRRRGRSLVGVLMLGGVAMFVAMQNQGEGLARVVSFLAGDQDTSTMARTWFWETAWTHIVSLPAGGGWGYFGTIPAVSTVTAEGGQLYPHSIALEIALEGGWAAGILFLILVAVSGLRLIRRANDTVTLTFFVLLVFTFINAMLSGDVNDNRLLWTVLMVSWVIPRQEKTSHFDHDDRRAGPTRVHASARVGGATAPELA